MFSGEEREREKWRDINQEFAMYASLGAEKTPEDIVEEEKLILKKIDVVNRRDALLTQVDKNRKM